MSGHEYQIYSERTRNRVLYHGSSDPLVVRPRRHRHRNQNCTLRNRMGLGCTYYRGRQRNDGLENIRPDVTSTAEKGSTYLLHSSSQLS